MQTLLRTFSLAASLVAVSAFAQFEGVLEMKMTVTDPAGASQGGDHSMKIALGKAGIRSEMTMQAHGMNMNITMLQQADKPDITYRINDAAKTYTEIDRTKFHEMAARSHDTAQYSVQKLGEEKILGYNTLHVRVNQTDPANTNANHSSELWVAKDIGDYGRYSRMSAQPRSRNAAEEGIAKALKDAGADGMPLKSVTVAEGGVRIVAEVVKIDKQALPASTFEIPAGYTKSTGGLMDLMGGMSGPQAEDTRKKMQDAMKNLTPEQRELIDKMMKEHHGATPNPPPSSP